MASRSFPRDGAHLASTPRVLAAAGALALAAVSLVPFGCTVDRQGRMPEVGSGATGGSTTSSVGASGATGGSGGTAATGAGAAGGAGTGGQTGEDCLNGVDDDQDGATDCADEDCAVGFACVPLGNTTGPYGTLSSGTCAAGLEEMSYFDCSDCSFQAIAGACSLVVTLYDRGTCTGVTATVGPSSAGCTDNADFLDHASDHVGATVVAEPDGSEQCIGEAATVGPTEYLACETATAGGGCGTESVCLPVADFPWCVLVQPEDPCPLGTSVAAFLYDSAGSGACECSGETSVLCPAAQSAALYDSSSSCSSGASVTVTADGACVNSGLSAVTSISVAPASSIVGCVNVSTLPDATAHKLCCSP